MTQARSTSVDRAVERAIRALEVSRAEGVPMRVTFDPPLGVYDARVPLEEQERTVTFTVGAVGFDRFLARASGVG